MNLLYRATYIGVDIVFWLVAKANNLDGIFKED